MTCIVGWQEKGNVWIGGDSAGTGSHLSIQNRVDEKVFRNGDFIFGFTTSFRMGQLIRYKLSIPKPQEDQDVNTYLHSAFLDSLIGCFTDNKYASIDNNTVEGGDFLFGYKGKLYGVEQDFQISQLRYNFASCGCAFDIALGCLYALKDSVMTPEERIIKALEAAVEFSAGVRPPFNIIKLNED